MAQSNHSIDQRRKRFVVIWKTGFDNEQVCRRHNLCLFARGILSAKAVRSETKDESTAVRWSQTLGTVESPPTLPLSKRDINLLPTSCKGCGLNVRPYSRNGHRRFSQQLYQAAPSVWHPISWHYIVFQISRMHTQIHKAVSRSNFKLNRQRPLSSLPIPKVRN